MTQKRNTHKNMTLVTDNDTYEIVFGSSQQYKTALSSFHVPNMLFRGSVDGLEFTFKPSAIRALYYLSQDLKEDGPTVHLEIIMTEGPTYLIPIKGMTRARAACAEVSQYMNDESLVRMGWFEILQETGKQAFVRAGKPVGVLIHQPTITMLQELNEVGDA